MKEVSMYSMWVLAIVGIAAGIKGVTGVDYLGSFGTQVGMIIDLIAGAAGLYVVYNAVAGKKKK